MTDNLQQRGGQDRRRIDVHQEYELRDWADRFGVTKEQLKEAVHAVGDSADAVERHLKDGRATVRSKRASSGSDRRDSGTSDRR